MIEITPLGAGQDVGRSCILLTIGNKNIMLDCGMHMGYDDARRFPDFSYISRQHRYTDLIDAVIITHFHLDHCGALPYFTEMCGYDGPIYMSPPTHAICPLLLEDYRKITVDRRPKNNSSNSNEGQRTNRSYGGSNANAVSFFTSEDIKACMRKVTTVNLNQDVQVDSELRFRFYYAGHVLGAVMVHIQVGTESAVYTGDYNMTPDRHLGAAWIDRVEPDVLITESTYATTIRDSKRARERDFLRKVHDCVLQGGKVLIPVFALGRAQELCILVEEYWERMGLTIPIYFSAGMTSKANEIYRRFIPWTNEKIKQTFTDRNMFEFKHISAFDMSYVDSPDPQVVFASPGMLHTGFSLEIFKRWAGDPKNMIILPGYCVPGTVGARVLRGETRIELDRGMTVIDVRLQVKNLSFSAHADAKGILQLVHQCAPRNVVLVHGEKEKMNTLKTQMEQDLNVRCFTPANGETVQIETRPIAEVDVSKLIYDQALKTYLERKDHAQVLVGPLQGILTLSRDKKKLRLDPLSEDAVAKQDPMMF
jgi:integrator complex subunit 11